ncbi:hypothetical protein QE389_000417 [Brevundimonas sp. SORGH_AS 993]|nr:hypothetical protein [Brevundimonas sp. SORGH_AS_0993]
MVRSTKSEASQPPPRKRGAFLTREYIGAMALELARMARGDGDERLARQLDQAAEIAAGPQGLSQNQQQG